jgi:hypothetical protein
MHDTNDVHDPPADERPRYRAVEFDDGLLIFDRTATKCWIHADTTVSLDDIR